MTGTLAHLVAAAIAFVGGHFLISSTPLRWAIVAKIGERAYLGVFSALAVVALAWLGLAYRAAPRIELWAWETGGRHLALTLVALASVFVVAGLTTPSPTVAGAGERGLDEARGIVRVTRHPFLWGVALWAVAHLAANGDSASVVLFASLMVLALAGTLAIDRKRKASLGEAWERFAGATSNAPFAAIASRRQRLDFAEIGIWRILGAVALYVALLFGHELVIGVDPLGG
ncbi:MAG: NnrU family protein [Rhodospirillales bacterium]|jgi:uncharacterized membrane protein|nr:NnrU family protein [Rhodospirillales bacterium]MDP6805655.1 NnrU family protein [Rhodospirillales bacterium]